MNEINIKKQTDGHGVQDSLSTSKSLTDVPHINEVQSTEQSPKRKGKNFFLFVKMKNLQSV